MTNEIVTILLGASPIFELRGAIPFAMGVYEFSAGKAYLLSVFGNLIPIIPVYLVVKFASNVLSHRFYWINRLLQKVFDYTRRRHAKKFENKDEKRTQKVVEAVALLLFVAIPLPVTGAWSGTLAAFVFGVPLRRALLPLSTGVMLAGIIVLGISTGAFAVL